MRGPPTRLVLPALALGLLCPAPAAAVPDCAQLPKATTLLSGQGRLESIASDQRGRLFYTDLTANRLLRLDGPGSEPVRIADVAVPGGLAFDHDGGLIAGFGNGVVQGLADNGQAGLLRLDPDTGQGGLFASGLGMANGVARGPDGAFYASNDFGSGIDRIIGGRVERHWAEVQSGNGLAVDSSGRYLYANQTFQPAAIARVEIANPGNVTTYAAPPVTDIAAGLDGMTRDAADRLFVTANASGEVWRVDTDRQICALARGLGMPSALAFGGQAPGFHSRNLYVVTFSGDLVELENATDRPPAAAAPRLTLRLRVRPRRAQAGRRTRFRFQLTAAGSGLRLPVPGATLRFGRRRTTTDANGEASIRRRFQRARRVRARATSPQYGAAVAYARILRARRRP